MMIHVVSVFNEGRETIKIWLRSFCRGTEKEFIYKLAYINGLRKLVLMTFLKNKHEKHHKQEMISMRIMHNT